MPSIYQLAGRLNDECPKPTTLKALMCFIPEKSI